jgi:hypothetical protein
MEGRRREGKGERDISKKTGRKGKKLCWKKKIERKKVRKRLIKSSDRPIRYYRT